MKYLITLFILLFSLTISSQDQAVFESESPEAEFHTAINPLDSNNIVIATMNMQSSTDFITDMTIYYSLDFGETWSISAFNGTLEGHTLSGDAVLSFDSEGNVILVNLSYDGGSNLLTIVSTSADGGDTWDFQTTVGSDFTDKPWLAADNFANSPNNGNIYIPHVAFTVTLNAVNGQYEEISSVTIPDGDQLPSVVVRKDGKVFTSAVGLSDPNIVYVQEYDNAGSEVVHSTSVVSFPDHTFDGPGVSLRFQPTAYLAIDNSGGPYDGRLYLSYTASEIVDEYVYNVFLTYSDDNGVTWSDPNIVHENTEEGIQQFYSSIYINGNGAVLMDWYDRKNYTNDNTLTDFMFGISTDGGDTFEEIQLNTVSSNFDFVVPSSNDFGIGEYHQLVATDNTALSFWSDGRTSDGNLNLFMAKVNLNDVVGIQEYSVVNAGINVSALYPMPSDNNVFIDMNLKKAQNMKYEISTTEGKLVSQSDWKMYNEGDHNLELNTSFNSGLYVVKIFNDKGFFKTLKLVIE